MGADVVIAVDLNWDLMGRHNRIADKDGDSTPPTSRGVLLDAILEKIRPVGRPGEATDMPSMLDVMTTSLNIMQVRITQSRLAGEPADVMIRPRLYDIAAMDYHMAAKAITEGEHAAEHALPLIADVME
jgi:NTE family protein